tara:strand:- start:108 stop:707 length:600 start_codon:yes stop_codon:yes gene_type:complete
MRYSFNYKIKIFKTILLYISFSILSCDNGSAQRNSDIKIKNNKSENRKIKNDNATIAPDFTLSDLNGELVSLSQLQGKVILLNFWGTWCGPCRQEIPDFIKLVEKHKDKGLEIIGVTLTSGSPGRIDDFAKKWGINYTLLTDIKGNETQAVTSLYGQATGRSIRGIPTTFLIDRDGFIRKKYVGPRSEKIFYNDIKPYL